MTPDERQLSSDEQLELRRDELKRELADVEDSIKRSKEYICGRCGNHVKRAPKVARDLGFCNGCHNIWLGQEFKNATNDAIENGQVTFIDFGHRVIDSIQVTKDGKIFTLTPDYNSEAGAAWIDCEEL